MDLTRLLSTLLPLLVELLLLVQCTESHPKTASRGLKMRRGSGSKKLKFLRKLLEEVSSDQTLGMIRLKKTTGQGKQSRIPNGFETVLRPDDAGDELKDNDEDAGAFGASGVEEFGAPQVKENKLNEAKHSDGQVEYRVLACPVADDGLRLFSCPTPDQFGVYKCIDDHQVCNGRPDCPQAEDEDGTACMFHKITINYFHFLMDAVFGYTQS